VLIFALLAGLVLLGSMVSTRARREPRQSVSELIEAAFANPAAETTRAEVAVGTATAPDTAPAPPAVAPTEGHLAMVELAPAPAPERAAARPIRERPPKPPRPRRPRDLEAHLGFLIPLALYLAVGVRLALMSDVIHGDALSRVGNAYYVVFSRDPHLAAVGFVWNPLPSLVLVPFLPLKFLWADLTRLGFIGNIESALFMAGTVALIRACLAEMGLRRAARLTITVLFAIHPMILIHGGYATSEAMFLFFLVLACRYLMRWLRSNELGGLAGTGVALGLAYWTRYEAIGAGLSTIALVVIVAFLRSRGTRRERLRSGFTEMAVVAMPFFFAVGSWAGASWLIVGTPFATLTSQYGSSNQIRLLKGTLIKLFGGDTFAARSELGFSQIFHLEPLILVVLVLATIVALSRKDPRVLAIVTTLGGVSAFWFLSLGTGRLYPFLRYGISIVPMVALLVGFVLIPRTPAEVQDARSAWDRFVAGALPGVTAATVALVLLAPAIPATVAAIRTPKLGVEESMPLHSLTGLSYPKDASVIAGFFKPQRDIARYLDNLRLRNGSVLTDTAFSFGVILASSNPEQFVVTSDLDFEQTAADPTQFRVKYLLVPSPNAASWDALNVNFPTLYADGAGIGRLVKEWKDAKNGWRLYSVTDTSVQ